MTAANSITSPFSFSGEIGRILGAKWKEMSDKEKAPYQAMADKDKTRASTEKEAYVSTYEIAKGQAVVKGIPLTPISPSPLLS